MKQKTYIAVYVLLHLLYADSMAQGFQIKFNQVEGNNSQPLGQINAITQDPNGYMWFSGQGANRIYQYDGIRMTAYKPDNLNPGSPFGASLETIYADLTGAIWIGFVRGGMERFNPATGVFKDYKHDSADAGSLSAGMVSAILRDHLGRLWVGTENGLDRFDEKTGKFIHYRNDPKDSTSLSSNVVRAIYEDHEGVLWIGTGFEFPFRSYKSEEDGGLNRMDKNGTFTRFMHDPENPKSLINNKVRAIFEDSRGTFWIGTSGDGLHTMDRITGTFERHTYDPANPQGLSRPPLKDIGVPDPITFITEDATGAIWIGTYISGITRYDPITKKITHYESSNGYPDKNCWAAFNSRDGVLWLSSTDQGGFLFRVDPKLNKIKEIPTSDIINTIFEDNQGMLWVCALEGGLLQYDENKKLVRQFKYDATDSIDLTRTNMNSIFQDQPDTLWLCTDTAIMLFDKKAKRFSLLKYKPAPGSPFRIFSGNALTSLIKDRSGLMWIASSNGLFQYDSKDRSIKKYIHDINDTTTIIANSITSVMESSSGDIWASSGDRSNALSFESNSNNVGGINRLNKNTGGFTRYLNGINILCMYNDSQGNIWAGSAGKGLYYFDKKNNDFISLFDAQSEIAKDPVLIITEDDLKNLWFITNSSIVKINADRKSYFVYGKKYGIRPNTLKFGGLCKTKSGDILVGNNNGFYVLSPKEMDEQTKPLQLIITGLLVNNQPMLTGDKSILTNPIEKTSKISLNYQQNNFSFTFAAIDYRAPEANKYYTLLENFDNEWRDAGGDKSANYVKVPPGHYIFHVKAINVDGVTAQKEIQITINPPWWRTSLAYTIYALLLLTMILLIHKFQKQRTIRAEQQKAQVKELEQAKEIEKAYHQLEQAHTELKSAQAQLIQSEKMASLGELTAGIAHEIQNPLNFVNNFSDINAELIDEANQEIDKGNLSEAKNILNDVKDNQEKINHHGKRADAIVKSMLQHTRGSSRHKEPTDINALADECLRLSYHGMRAKDKSFNASIETEFDETLEKINVVPQDIGRVILNFINNAFYAVNEKQKAESLTSAPLRPVRPGGQSGLRSDGQKAEGYEPTVSVATKKENGKVIISVKDNGNGIPDSIKEKIFQPFFTTKPAGQGTGLGLSLSYDIVKAHAGEIEVESKTGEGSRFRIILPLE